MPSQVVLANTVAQSIAAEDPTRAIIVDSIHIENGHASTRDISVVDSFTPSVTNGVASPTAKTITRWITAMANSSVATYSKQELKGVRCLGALTILASSTQAACNISVGYHFE